MNAIKKSQRPHGNEGLAHKPNKQDANLQKNGTLRFQIGLLTSLAVTYFVMGATFGTIKPEPLPMKPPLEDNEFVYHADFIPEEETAKTEKLAEKSKTYFREPEIVPDDLSTKKAEEYDAKNQPTSEIANVGDIKYEKPVDNDIVVDFIAVENVPVFPGCESLSTNEEKKACMSKAINQIIRKNFDVRVGERYGITGINRIPVQFTIDKAGQITDVKVRSPHKVLEDEAKRVIELIPVMKPGRQRETPVKVKFSLPIVVKLD